MLCTAVHPLQCACRYAAFLDGIKDREPLSHEFFHAYPQSVKTLVGEFDAIINKSLSSSKDWPLSPCSLARGSSAARDRRQRRRTHSRSPMPHAVHGWRAACIHATAASAAVPPLLGRLHLLWVRASPGLQGAQTSKLTHGIGH